MSLTTNRIALSTIKDSHLNSSPSNTPSKDKKLPTLYNSNKPKSKLFSPSHLRIRQPDLITKSFSIAHSATSLNKKFSPLRAVSFSDYRSTLSNKPLSSSSSSSSSSPSNLKLQSTDDAFKNDTIGLAATKLKLKLQLALYKVQQNKQTRLKTTKYYNNNNNNNINSYNHKIHKTNGHKSMAIKLNSILGSLESPPTSNRSSPVSAYESPNTTNNNHMVKSSTASLPTPPEQVRTSNYYSHSINVNLNATPRFNKTKLLKNITKPTNSTTSTLNKVASSRTKNTKINKPSKLKLFQIKKNSIYYCSNQKKLPLSQNNTTHVTNQSKYTNNLDITATNGTTHSFNNMSTPSSQGTVTGGAGNGQSMSFFTFYPTSQEQKSSQNSTTNVGTTRLPSITVDRTTNEVPSNRNTNHAQNSFYSSLGATNTALPSINKILKTPIRRANNASKQFLFQRSFNNAAPLVTNNNNNNNSNTYGNDETTIDEDNDMTIIQNTTISNTTIDQNATIDEEKTEYDVEQEEITQEIKNSNEEDDNEDINSPSKQQDILTSSPLSNQQFTTPNKFSVAKSLLQLGGHRM